MASTEDRVLALEELVNQLQVAMRNLASKQQLRQLILLRQEEYTALEERVAILEAEVATLQGSLG